MLNVLNEVLSCEERTTESGKHAADEIKKQPWFESVDCSENIAYVINELNYGRSIGDALKGRDEVLKRIRVITKEVERENN